MRFKQWHWAILFLVSCASALWAQEIPRIRHFSPTDYSGQNQNWSLAQLEQGWMYAGNNGGIIELDGAVARTYTLPDQQTVRCVAAGKDNTVFCGGMGEFGFWKPAPNGVLEYTSLTPGVVSETLQNDEIWHILVQPNYVLFQSFSTIYKYDYQSVIQLKPPGNIMFAHAVNGQILLPVIGRGIVELLPDNTFQFLEHTAVLGDKSVQFLVKGNAGEIWAGTANHGIFSITQNTCKPFNAALNALFAQYQLNKAVALSNGGWAIGTILNGVYILNAQTQLQYHIHRENGLQNNTVLAITEDNNGNLWLGLDRGIDCIALSNPLRVFDDQTGQIGTVYDAIAFEGRLYIGTNHGVFSKKIPTLNTFQPEKFKIVEGTQGQVWHLNIFDNQLICGHNSGTFSIKNGTAQRISNTNGGWCTIQVPNHPHLLLQSTYSDLIVFKKSSTGHWQFAHTVEGLNASLKKIEFDQDGHLWGQHSNKGHYRLKLNDDWTQVIALKTFTDKELPATRRMDSKRLSGIDPEYFTLDSSGINVHTEQGTVHFPIYLVPNYEHIAAVSDSQYLFCLESGYALLHRRQIQPYQTHSATGPVIRRIETVQGEPLAFVNGSAFKWSQNSLKFYFSLPYFDRPPLYSWKLEGFSKQWSPWQHDATKEFINLPEGAYTLLVRSDINSSTTQFHFQVRAPWYRSGWAYGAYALLLIGLFYLFEKYNRLRLSRQRLNLEAEKERELAIQKAEAEKEILLLEVENKNRDLTNAAFNLIRKNEALLGLKDELSLTAKGTGALDKIIRHIDQHLEGDHDWEIVEASFNQVHNDFFKRLKQNCPELTPGDLRLAAYLKMNLSSKEIAPLFNISIRGVENKRYRLRKKLGLPEDANLTAFMLEF